MKGVSNMAIKKYIGARYAPQFMGAWDKASEYAALSVVYTNDQSYVSRKTVPANTEITNTEFWIKSADWNAQVTQYNQNVEQYQANVERYNQNVETYTQAVDQFYADTLHSYDTKADMVADHSLKLGDTLLTTGGTAIGDGGGSFYQVVPETSAKAVALDNGLFALPFEFQPYDYSEFQGEVDRVVESFNQNTKQLNQKFNTSVTEIKNASLNNYNTEADMVSDLTLEANRTVLTSGKAQIGDNLGSFYRIQNTSARDDAVNLSNGKKAVPFQIQGGIASGSQLNYLGQSNVPAVWNVKAPDTVTIPLSVSAGGVVTVFLSVLYGANESTVTANLNINNGTVKTITFTDNGDSTHDKIVVYAITVKWDGSAYSWGSATSTSWNVTYDKDIVSVTVKLPANAPQPVSEQYAGADPAMDFTVSNNITLKTITTNFAEAPTDDYSTGINTIKLFQYNDSTKKYDIVMHSNDRVPEGEYVNAINKTLTPDSKYQLEVSRSILKNDASGLTLHKYGTQATVPGGAYNDIVVSADSGNEISVVFNYDKQ
jgi:hypothetical protein